jgi:hypothetical protein
MLGVRVGGNIGGELGLRTELGVKTDNSIRLLFKPKAKVNAGLSSSIQVLNFASAKVEGIVSIMAFNIAASADLGYIKAADYSYAHSGIDGAELVALDGKVDISAKAEVAGILPAGIDPSLWTLILNSTGINQSKLEWKHTIWDPKPIKISDMPAYGSSFMKFFKKPRGLSDCQASVALVGKTLDEHIALVRENAKILEGVEALLSAQSILNLTEIKDETNKYCAQF